MRPISKLGIPLYMCADWLSATLAWIIFVGIRKTVVEKFPVSFETVQVVLSDIHSVIGIIVLPISWVVFYAILGTYFPLYRKSRLQEFSKTAVLSLLGCCVIFFTVILDDLVGSYTDFTYLFCIILGLHFGFTAFTRLGILTIAKTQIKSGQVGFNTIIVGCNSAAWDIFSELQIVNPGQGYRFVGFVDIGIEADSKLQEHLPYLGMVHTLPELIRAHKVEEVIIAVDSRDHEQLSQIIDSLANMNVIVKIVPDTYDILSGSVRIHNLYGPVLREISPDLMPRWQRTIKRMIDIAVSALFLLIFSPLYCFIAIRVKMSSKGNIFYKQERIGLQGIPFNIIKFRSMWIDAEKCGPALSSDHDPRITPWGKVMRKWRLDELPQFWNILKGEMSLVGPRPERQFFIDKILEFAPSYVHIRKVKPGLSSFGMVKYGYAENVDQMVQRLRYDLLYIENVSLALDIKILFYTFITIIKGKGK